MSADHPKGRPFELRAWWHEDVMSLDDFTESFHAEFRDAKTAENALRYVGIAGGKAYKTEIINHEGENNDGT